MVESKYVNAVNKPMNLFDENNMIVLKLLHRLISNNTYKEEDASL